MTEDQLIKMVAAVLAGAKTANEGESSHDEYLAEYDAFVSKLKDRKATADQAKPKHSFEEWAEVEEAD